MKFIALLLTFVYTGIGCFAQQKYFEGSLVYRSSVKSKIDNLSDKDAQKVLAAGDVRTVAVKNGNYRQTSEYADVFTIRKDKKAYIKFRKIDTLYYLDYAFDTSRVMGVVKSDSVLKVNNYLCKSITIKTSNSTKRYYYSDSLRNNPVYDQDNTIDQYNLYSRETGGAMYLLTRSEYTFAVQTDSCTRIEQKSIDDHVFDLPALPLKDLSTASLHSIARFPGKEGAWLKYLESNLDSKLGIKYIKLPKGQSEASATVLVEFIVAEDGTISNIQVLNKNAVHPRLAEEAVRVIKESPRWVPANFYGEKITSSCRQPIVFKVMQ